MNRIAVFLCVILLCSGMCSFATEIPDPASEVKRLTAELAAAQERIYSLERDKEELQKILEDIRSRVGSNEPGPSAY
jgi:hypothetical protein